MSTETENKKLLTLISSDNQKFEIDIAAALQSQTIKHIVEDDCADNAIPLANVSSEILIKVIEYLKKHAEEEDKENKNDKESLKNFDKEFVNKVSQEELFNLVLAANYLNIKGLMDLTCKTAADRMEDMSVEEVRELFHIECDLTPEEEDEIRNAHAWAHEQENSSS